MKYFTHRIKGTLAITYHCWPLVVTLRDCTQKRTAARKSLKRSSQP